MAIRRGLCTSPRDCLGETFLSLSSIFSFFFHFLSLPLIFVAPQLLNLNDKLILQFYFYTLKSFLKQFKKGWVDVPANVQYKFKKLQKRGSEALNCPLSKREANIKNFFLCNFITHSVIIQHNQYF